MPLRGPFYEWYPLFTRRQVFDFTLNVWFYIPVGFLGFYLFGKRFSGLLLSILAGLSISLAVEYGQLYVPGRYSGTPDLVANFLGTVTGAALAYAGTGRRLAPWILRVVHSPGWRLSPDRALLLTLWILAEGFPLFPDLNQRRAADALRSITYFTLDWNQALATFLSFLILTIALGRSYWTPIAFALIPAQAFLDYHSFSVSNLIVAAAAWAIGSALGRRLSTERFAPALSVALLAALLAEELRPFTTKAVHTPVGWVPFGSLFDGNLPEFYFSTIFRKLLLYTGSIWALRRLKWRLWPSTAAVVTTLALGEFSQQWVPNRTPETTDLVLAVGGALLVKGASVLRASDSS